MLFIFSSPGTVIYSSKDSSCCKYRSETYCFLWFESCAQAYHIEKEYYWKVHIYEYSKLARLLVLECLCFEDYAKGAKATHNKDNKHIKKV